jgi:hypothetical protein
MMGRLRLPWVLVCVASVWIALLPAPVDATQIVPLSIAETARQAEAIVVGTVRGVHSRWGDASRRWMQTDYELVVDDVVQAPERGAPVAGAVSLTFWGGTIGDETQRVAGVRVPREGEQLLVMLHPRWRDGSVTPTVGWNQGLFIATVDAGGREAIVDGDGQLVTLTGAQSAERSGVRSDAIQAPGLGMAGFAAWLRANLAVIKSVASVGVRQPDAGDPHVQQTFAKTPDSAAADGTTSGAPSAGVKTPRGAADAIPAPTTPAAVQLPLYATPGRTAAKGAMGRVTPKYEWINRGLLPIVVNNFPDSFAPWSPEDEYLMARWNYYANDVFRVRTTPTGTFGWRNGSFDLDGWLTEAKLQEVYGASWYCGTGCTVLGLTFQVPSIDGFIIEADIALNAAASYTLDDEWVFEGAAAAPFRLTMLHELGHMMGLEHNFNELATMNYLSPGGYRAFGLPYSDDANGIRSMYPPRAIGRTDLAVYLYRETRNCNDGSHLPCIREATYPSNVVAGQNLTVADYFIENAGTTTIVVPTIEWYLSAGRNFTAPYHYLGTATYAPMNTFTHFDPTTVAKTFQVPADVPSGSYYLAAYIRNDDGASQPAFPFSNNFAFSMNRIRVMHPGAIVMELFDQSVSEAAGLVALRALRVDGSDGNTSTRFSMFNGTAKAGQQYTAVTGQLSWPDGDSSPKTFYVPLLNDGPGTGEKYFYATLDIPTGLTQIGVPDTTVVHMLDTTVDVWPPACEFPAGFTKSAGATKGWTLGFDSAHEGGCSLKSDVLGDAPSPDEAVAAQVQFTGQFRSGNIAFARRVSSEYAFDCLRFVVDGVQQDIGGTCVGGGGLGASGAIPWGLVAVPITAGTHTIQWSFERDFSVGSGENAAWIDSLVLPVPTRPGPPTGVSALSGNAEAALGFSTPGDDGGLPILSYTATCTPATGPVKAASGAGSPLPVPGLVNGSTYTCTVRATNSLGDSMESAASNPVTPANAAAALLTVSVSGSGTGAVASIPPGIGCPPDCGEYYPAGTGVQLTTTPTNGAIFTGWTGGKCTGFETTCLVTLQDATTVTATFAAAGTQLTLDVDGSGPAAPYDALTDGLLIIRFMSGQSGPSLAKGALAADATRDTSAAVAGQMLDLWPLLDVDGNGVVEWRTDGLLILRFLFGITGDASIDGALGIGATRITAEDIRSYLLELAP